jgi:hypothetical protein
MKDSIKGILYDTTLFFHEISPKAIDWVNENYVPSLNKNTTVQKAAGIMSESLIEQLSIEDTVSGFEYRRYQLQYFSSTETAKKWLLA